MSAWADINYRGFWDVPRIFFVRHDDRLYLFDCPFDEGVEDYAENYQVYLMPEIPEADLPKDWTTLPARAIRRVGEVPVASVKFDPTKRRQIDTAILDALTPRPAHSPG
jgi:hypothetical protein